MTEFDKKTYRVALRIIAVVIVVLGISLFIEIITPDAKNPLDRKPNLEEDLKPIKEKIVSVLFLIGGLLFLLSFLFRRKDKLN